MKADFELAERRRVCDEEEWTRKEYYQVTNRENMEKYVRAVELEMLARGRPSVSEIEEMIKEKGDEFLKKGVKQKVGGEQDIGADPPWINYDIKREIKKRREINRRRRGTVGDERDRLWGLYKEQKAKVGRMVRESKADYEKKVADEVKKDRSKGKMWDLINKLKGGDDRKTRKSLYNEAGEKVDIEDEGELMMGYWRNIYQGRGNGIEQVWNGMIRHQYERESGNGKRELGWIDT